MSRRPGKTLEPFIMLPLHLVESEAFRAANETAIKVLVRIYIEHVRHYRRNNGKLIITYKDFEDFGVRKEGAAKALVYWEDARIIGIKRGGWKPGKGKVPICSHA